MEQPPEALPQRGNVAVFIPFSKSMLREPDESASLSGQAAFMKGNFQFNGKAADREFTVAIHNSDKGREQLRNLGPKDTLYIMGHGGAGSDTICSNLKQVSLFENIPANTVLQRMKDAGIPGDVGKIKLFCCHSAEGEGQNFLKAFDEARKQFEGGMYAKAELTGYNGSLNTQGVPFGDDKMRKTATVRDALSGQTEMKRASEAAVHIPERRGGIRQG